MGTKRCNERRDGHANAMNWTSGSNVTFSADKLTATACVPRKAAECAVVLGDVLSGGCHSWTVHLEYPQADTSFSGAAARRPDGFRVLIGVADAAGSNSMALSRTNMPAACAEETSCHGVYFDANGAPQYGTLMPGVNDMSALWDCTAIKDEACSAVAATASIANAKGLQNRTSKGGAADESGKASTAMIGYNPMTGGVYQCAGLSEWGMLVETLPNAAFSTTIRVTINVDLKALYLGISGSADVRISKELPKAVRPWAQLCGGGVSVRISKYEKVSSSRAAELPPVVRLHANVEEKWAALESAGKVADHAMPKRKLASPHSVFSESLGSLSGDLEDMQAEEDMIALQKATA